MTRQEFSRWRSYQKTLMAVYWLSDGLRCYATWAELSAETGLHKDTVKHYLARLEKAGIIRIPGIWDRPGRGSLVVLLDHPDAAEYLAGLEKSRRGGGKFARREIW